MEVDFGQEAYGTHFDSFMRHYLTVKTGEIPNVREVYDAFKFMLARRILRKQESKRWLRIFGITQSISARWRPVLGEG
jgi:hypothetical protein